ncbi:MAG TPA: L-type lectin-domain containing protein, partial [Bryobacteraceae bacterium]|nr:L-type lectin-domain containing protein [Bryobacteraceae bacterium]
MVLATAIAQAAIRYDNFRSTEELSLVGDARVSGNALRITPAKNDRSGAVWLREKQLVASGFDTTFQFQLTHQGGMGHGADGFAFVIQNSGPGALGGFGSAGGFAVDDGTYRHRDKGIPWSVAVFFDTYKNDDEHDPSNNYIGLCTYGRPADMRWPATRLALAPDLPFDLKDGAVHTVRILFQPPVLSVFLDGAADPVLKAAVDLSIVVDQHGSAWVGFTASTGGGYENHDILNWSFHRSAVSSNISAVDSDITFPMAACLPNRNLCTPERAIVEPSGAGYHVILPANLEWGASVPESAGGAMGVKNAHGIVCWDVNAPGSDGCSGPSGNGPPAGDGFVDADAPPGALVMRIRDGRVWVSVNGRRGAAFRDNQGFYEFD